MENTQNTQQNSQKAEESFSEHTQKILAYAKSEAQKKGTELIGTEYILLGLLDLKDEVLSKITTKLAVNLDDLKEYVHYNLTGSGKALKTEPGLSPRTKRVLDLAQEERMTMNHRYVEGEHLLLGLIKEGEGMGFQILKRFGITYENAQASILEVVGKGKESETSTQVATPLLDKFGENFSNKAREGKLDPVIGRSEEIERVLRILSRRRKNNPVLIGDPGVGKTAIVEGMAFRMVTGDIPDVLKGKRIVGLSMMSLMAGASKRGEFEERLQNVLKEVKNTNGEVILFFDEMHTLISADNGSDTANILKPVLARGEIQCVGATTTNEYHRYIEKDAALERRFQPVVVPEPNYDDTLAILKGLRDKYESFHRVIIPDEVLIESIKLSNRYIFDRFQPDKSIDLIDEAGAATRLPSFSAPKKVQEMEVKMDKLNKELEAAKRNNLTDEVTKLEQSLTDQQKTLDEMKEDINQEKAKTHDTIAKETLKEIIAKWTGIPLRHLKESESDRLLKMEDYLHERLIGQEEAVTLVSQAIRRGRAGLKKENKPIGTFLFMGSTGTGKTELAKTLAEYLFGTEESMIRFDMSEYMEKHSYFRLIGAPPGYVGYEEGGQLTEAVRKKPFAVILFDEIEKAHKDIFNLFLQIFDDGRLTDSKGHVVNFKNAIIICTSNVGSTKIQQKMFEFNQSRAAMKSQMELMKKRKDAQKPAEEATVVSSDTTAAAPAPVIDNNPDNLPMVVEEKDTDITTPIPNEGELSGIHAEENQAEADHPEDAPSTDSAMTEEEKKAAAVADELKKSFMKSLKKDLVEDLKEFLRPEMINRFDELIIFEPLSKANILAIVDVMMKDTLNNLKEVEINMGLTQAAKVRLADLGYDPVFGARPLKRVIQSMIDTPLSDLLISSTFQPKDIILCDVQNSKFTFTKVDKLPDMSGDKTNPFEGAGPDDRLSGDAPVDEEDLGEEGAPADPTKGPENVADGEGAPVDPNAPVEPADPSSPANQTPTDPNAPTMTKARAAAESADAAGVTETPAAPEEPVDPETHVGLKDPPKKS